MEKQRKNLDISKDAITLIAVQAAWDGSNFKNVAEKIIEKYAEELKMKMEQKMEQQVAA